MNLKRIGIKGFVIKFPIDKYKIARRIEEYYIDGVVSVFYNTCNKYDEAILFIHSDVVDILT